ncbi:hypothetical protein SNEBB_001226, partial [Seison nebaliae]
SRNICDISNLTKEQQERSSVDQAVQQQQQHESYFNNGQMGTTPFMVDSLGDSKNLFLNSFATTTNEIYNTEKLIETHTSLYPFTLNGLTDFNKNMSFTQQHAIEDHSNETSSVNCVKSENTFYEKSIKNESINTSEKNDDDRHKKNEDDDNDEPKNKKRIKLNDSSSNLVSGMENKTNVQLTTNNQSQHHQQQQQQQQQQNDLLNMYSTSNQFNYAINPTINEFNINNNNTNNNNNNYYSSITSQRLQNEGQHEKKDINHFQHKQQNNDIFNDNILNLNQNQEATSNILSSNLVTVASLPSASTKPSYSLQSSTTSTTSVSTSFNNYRYETIPNFSSSSVPNTSQTNTSSSRELNNHYTHSAANYFLNESRNSPFDNSIFNFNSLNPTESILTQYQLSQQQLQNYRNIKDEENDPSQSNSNEGLSMNNTNLLNNYEQHQQQISNDAISNYYYNSYYNTAAIVATCSLSNDYSTGIYSGSQLFNFNNDDLTSDNNFPAKNSAEVNNY